MRSFVFPFLFAACLSTHAAPVEFDTDSVHVIVIRPLDAWSGDASNAEDRLDALRDKKAYYEVAIDDPETGKRLTVNGGAQGFGHVSKHPFAQAGKNALAQSGFSLSQDTKIGFGLDYPIAVAPQDWATFTSAQAKRFNDAVISQGDPATLQSRTKTRKFFGGLFAVATMVVGVDKLGATSGLSATLSSGVADDAYRITMQAGQAMAPVRLPALDLASYKSIEVRRLTNFLAPTGQLIFAYKADKTPEAERDALLKSIVVIAGAGTTPEEVMQSRVEDYQARTTIWKACVEANDPRCTPQ